MTNNIDRMMPLQSPIKYVYQPVIGHPMIAGIYHVVELSHE